MPADLSRRGLFRALSASGRYSSAEEAAPAERLVARISAACVEPKGITCRRCGESCEKSAIRFRPMLGGRTAIELDDGRCDGCGVCVPVCPTHAISLISADRSALVSGLAEMRSAS